MASKPQTGEIIPRARDASGVEEKLTGYALRSDHEHGAAKARGFAAILGITLRDAEYLADSIRRGLLSHPVIAVHDNVPYGVKCVVDIRVRGLGPAVRRTANVRTIWEIVSTGAAPRLVSVYPKI